LDVPSAMMVDRRRADIHRLVRQALAEASRKQRRIETIDPLVACAKRLFPYLHERVLYEYARTALRVIRNRTPGRYQTTLLTHIPASSPRPEAVL